MSGFNRGSSGFPKNKNSRIVYLLNSHLIRNRYKLKHYRVIPFFSTTRGHLRLLAFSTLSTIYVNFRLTNDIPTEQGNKNRRESEHNDCRIVRLLLLQHSNFAVSINFFPFLFLFLFPFVFLYYLLKCYAYQPSPSRREDCRRSKIRLEPANCNV